MASWQPVLTRRTLRPRMKIGQKATGNTKKARMAMRQFW